GRNKAHGVLATSFFVGGILHDLADIRQQVGHHLDGGVILEIRQLFHGSSLLLGFGRAGLDIYFVGHGILCAHGVVPHKRESKLALAFVGALDLEAAGIQGVHQVNGHVTALGLAVLVGVIARPPDVGKVGVQQVVAGHYLGLVAAGNVGNADQGLDGFGGDGDKGAAHGHLVGVQLLELLHVFGAVVD